MGLAWLLFGTEGGDPRNREGGNIDGKEGNGVNDGGRRGEVTGEGSQTSSELVMPVVSSLSKRHGVVDGAREASLHWLVRFMGARDDRLLWWW